MILKEGVSAPFGYGFVRYRIDMMATEVALIPFNWILRFVYWLQWKSHRPMTEDELRTLQTVKELMELRGERKYTEGYEKGLRDGEERMVTVLALMKAHGLDTHLTDKDNQ